ncbi:MAG TPA: NADH-dependent flavin oxidoreductase [Succinivibrionaceae bacterium]|nr:NADH-dependent flavin oxidoreductase [Succinivibrionaceae bacterium]
MDSRILFEPFTFNNGVKVNSRLAVAPLTLFSSNQDGSVSDEEKKFLEVRADHIGLYIQGATLVSKNGQAFPCQPRAISDADLDALRKRAEIIKKQGALSIVQIHHGGEFAVPELTGQAALSSSAHDSIEELTEDQILKIIDDFAHAAELCIKAGNDGVEIHGANQYLLQQFFSDKMNRRTDKWGGSLENRLRFPLAVVDAVCAVREKLNRPDFIIGYRLSPEEPGERGITMTDTVALLNALMEKSIQYIHVSQWNFSKTVRRGVGEGESRLKIIHDTLKGKLPVIGLGSLFTMNDYIQAMQSGFVEFVGCGKAIMMNPHLGTRLFEGKADEIVTELDLSKEDHYAIPSPLWEMCTKAQDWLPPVKGVARKQGPSDSVTEY